MENDQINGRKKDEHAKSVVISRMLLLLNLSEYTAQKPVVHMLLYK